MAKDRERLDVLLLRRGLFPSRERAQAALMAGRVLVNGQKQEKSGCMVDPLADIQLLGEEMPYVSRGGLKLARALRVFDIRLTGKVVMDIGASTGGFTDCALQNGAGKVYAVDVGYGQLAWKLRQDPRVVSMERVNARSLAADGIPERVDVITVDVSFISLKNIFPVLSALLLPGGETLALVKPQFEAGREYVGKHGVVRDPAVHEAVLLDIMSAARLNGFAVKGLDFSPIKGPKGNIEYLLYLGGGDDSPAAGPSAVVAAAWREAR